MAEKSCRNCQFYKATGGKICCAARSMAEIPNEVVNRDGGCSKWETARIQNLMNAIKELNKVLMAFQVPLSIEEKEALLGEHGNGWSIIKNLPARAVCRNCQHCVEWEGKWCCSLDSTMKPIAFDINNDIGCKSFYEKDYIPF